MSNNVTGRIWVLDTVGILTTNPVRVKKVVWNPTAASQSILFNEYEDTENDKVMAGSTVNTAGAISGTNTFTSAGNLPAGIADGYIFKLIDSTNTTTGAAGVAANLNLPKLVTTAGTGDAVVCSGAGWTNESGCAYTWITLPSTPAIEGMKSDASGNPVHLDFGPEGRRFENLVLETCEGGTVYLYMM